MQRGIRKNPKSDKVHFNYDRKWISFRVPEELVGDLLKRELVRQRRADLPPLYVDIADSRLAPLKKMYEKANEMRLYSRLLAARQKAEFITPRFIFAVSNCHPLPLCLEDYHGELTSRSSVPSSGEKGKVQE